MSSDIVENSPTQLACTMPRVSTVMAVNGEPRTVQEDPRATLLDSLRDTLLLTGTKKDGREVTTVEGLAHEGQFHPLQAAFIRHDSFQCGYCTPGQIISAVALLDERAQSDDDIREFMSGHICRCGPYPNILAAIRDVASSGASDATV